MKATDNDDKEGSNDGGGEDRDNAILLNSHVVQSLQRKLNK